MTAILVANDDGYDAPGILALAEALRELGDVQVSAPVSNQSACGHAISLHEDIPYRRCEIGAGIPTLAVSGSPADCIAIALLGLVDATPDIVVTGINSGANMGQDLTYSGTVTSALEAAIHGYPAVAVSLATDNAKGVEDFRVAGRVALAVARMALRKSLPPYTILSVNVPPVATMDELAGIRLTRQGERIYIDELKDVPGGVARVETLPPTGKLDLVGTDIWAVHRNFVSVTPIHLDMTAHQFMADLAAWDLRLP